MHAGLYHTVPIDRCYCREIPFTELHERAMRDGLNVEQLCATTGAGTGCGLCRTYLRVVLATGRTSLPVMNEREVAAACGAAIAPRAGSSAAPTPRDG